MNYYQQKNIKNLLGRKLYYFIAIALTIAITIGSLIPTINITEKPVQFFDKIVHALSYCTLTLSWLLVFKKESKRLINKFLTITAVFIYGIIIEVLQGTFTTYRQADLFDTLANLLGIISAYILFSIFLQKNI